MDSRNQRIGNRFTVVGEKKEAKTTALTREMLGVWRLRFWARGAVAPS